jgi:hypothetical protein
MQCIALDISWCFWGTNCLHLHSRSVWQASRVLYLLACCWLSSPSTLKTEAECSLDLLAHIHHTTRCNMPEDNTPQSPPRVPQISYHSFSSMLFQRENLTHTNNNNNNNKKMCMLWPKTHCSQGLSWSLNQGEKRWLLLYSMPPLPPSSI